MAFSLNYFALLAYTYWVDSVHLQFPLVVLLSAMTATTYLMQEVSYTVPPMVQNIVVLWFVIVFLTQPY
jgi:hypothetical protein